MSETYVCILTISVRTFAPHPGLEAFPETAELALVAVVLVDGTVPAAATRVRQVPANGSLEKALASLAGELSVVLSGTLVSADNALHGARHGRPDGSSGLLLLVVDSSP